MTTLSTYIRDQAFNRLTTAPALATLWKSTRRVPIPTLQGDQLPCLAVYLMRETMSPDGDDNVSVPRFVSDAVIGISVFENADKPETLDGSLDPLADTIENTLLQDISFVSLVDATGAPLIESFPQLQRSFSYPQSGEFYLAEVRILLTVRYRVYFEPIATTTLNEVDVHVSPFDNTIQSGNYSTAITNLNV